MFWRKKPQKQSVIQFETAELYAAVKHLEQRINIIEMDMGLLQAKIKDKFFKKPPISEEKEQPPKTENFKFFNPFGN